MTSSFMTSKKTTSKKDYASVEKFIDKSVEKGKMTPEDKKQILGRIHGTTTLEDMKDADLVIEAILEQVALKKEVFQKLDGICKKETLFASNTSTIPITDLASCNETTGPVHRDAFHEPRAFDETRRSHPWITHIR